jgi:GntR family transcriptional regulator
VVIRSRRYLADGQPIETAMSYIPAAIAVGTRIAEVDTGPGGIYARLEEAGHQLDKFVEEVTARMPTAEERRRLRLASGTPVLTVLRTAFDTDGVPVEVCDTVRHTVVSLLLELGTPPHVVQAIARHADIDVTMSIYAHTNLDAMREALDKIDWEDDE